MHQEKVPPTSTSVEQNKQRPLPPSRQNHHPPPRHLVPLPSPKLPTAPQPQQLRAGAPRPQRQTLPLRQPQKQGDHQVRQKHREGVPKTNQTEQQLRPQTAHLPGGGGKEGLGDIEQVQNQGAHSDRSGIRRHFHRGRQENQQLVFELAPDGPSRTA